MNNQDKSGEDDFEIRRDVGKKKHGHRYNKPNLSYVAILGIIIQNSQTGFLSLKEIYKSLGNFHPYFLGKYEGWKNSVRHTLSVSCCFNFVKVKNKKYFTNLWSFDEGKLIFHSKRTKEEYRSRKLAHNMIFDWNTRQIIFNSENNNAKVAESSYLHTNILEDIEIESEFSGEKDDKLQGKMSTNLKQSNTIDCNKRVYSVINDSFSNEQNSKKIRNTEQCSSVNHSILQNGSTKNEVSTIESDKKVSIQCDQLLKFSASEEKMKIDIAATISSTVLSAVQSSMENVYSRISSHTNPLVLALTDSLQKVFPLNDEIIKLKHANLSNHSDDVIKLKQLQDENQALEAKCFQLKSDAYKKNKEMEDQKDQNRALQAQCLLLEKRINELEQDHFTLHKSEMMLQKEEDCEESNDVRQNGDESHIENNMKVKQPDLTSYQNDLIEEEACINDLLKNNDIDDLFKSVESSSISDAEEKFDNNSNIHNEVKNEISNDESDTKSSIDHSSSNVFKKDKNSIETKEWPVKKPVKKVRICNQSYNEHEGANSSSSCEDKKRIRSKRTRESSMSDGMDRSTSFDEIHKFVQQVKSYPDDHEFTSVKGFTLSKHDLMTLNANSWINDEVINCWFFMLALRSCHENYPTVYAVNSYIFKQFCPKNKSLLLKRKADLCNYELVIFPIHLEMENHWILGVCDHKQKVFALFDSLPIKNQEVFDSRKQILDKMVKFIEIDAQKNSRRFYANEYLKIEDVKENPKQTDLYNCGLCTMKSADLLTRRVTIFYNTNPKMLHNERVTKMFELAKGVIKF